jgi:predicted nicotinamide N-methyase
MKLGRFECHEYVIPVAGRQIRLLGPARPDDLLDDPDLEARFRRDEYLPYWAVPWISAVVLAEHVLSLDPPPAEPMLEIGAGLGLLSVALGASGRTIVSSDYDPDALLFISMNASRNSAATVSVAALDWRTEPPERFATILAADVMYDRRNLEPLARFLTRALAPGGRAYLADPSRRAAGGFPAALADARLTFTVHTVHGVTLPALDPSDAKPVDVQIFAVRAAPD